MAFGIEESFVEKSAAANAPTPKWWGKPLEQRPDVGDAEGGDQASPTYTSEPAAPAPKAKKARTKSGIRRIAQPVSQAPPGALLKHIQPTFQAFLKTTDEVFSKSPLLDEDKAVDFAAKVE